MMQPHGVSNAGLAVWVTLITLTILGVTLLSSMLDAQLRAARLATRLNRANQELRQLAMHDNLTTLPNRVMLEQQLDLAIKQAMLNEHRFAVIYMDLDGFKAVNDTWGHHVGDRLLVAVAERLCSQLSNTMLLVRLGGDEFVLMAECDISAARQLAQNWLKLSVRRLNLTAMCCTFHSARALRSFRCTVATGRSYCLMLMRRCITPNTADETAGACLNRP